MSICRPIAVLLFSAVLLSGCATESLPPFDAPTHGGQAGGGWLAFLPVSEVLSGNAGDFRRSGVELAVLEGRLHRLRSRAVTLRGPIIAPVMRARLQRVGARQQP